MSTLTVESKEEVRATDVHFTDSMLYITLSDAREIGIPFKRIHWLAWLAQATPEQRGNWSLEPGGFAVWWDELDDGLEIGHLLQRQPL
jgi:hypothetical protein